MAQQALTELRFPLGGLNRRFGYQSQPPYTSPSCLNVRPDGNSVGRERGGSRPGLAKAFSQQLGGGSPVRLLNVVQALPLNSMHTIEEPFDDNPMDTAVWDYGAGVGGFTNAPATTSGEAAAPAPYNYYGAVLDAPTLFDPTAPYAASIVASSIVTSGGSTIQLVCAGMNNATPDWGQDSIVAFLSRTRPSTSPYYADLRLYKYTAGVRTTLANTSWSGSSSETSGTLTLRIASGIATVTLAGKTLSAAVGTLAGSRVGFGIQHASSAASDIEHFSFVYSDALSTKPNMLVTSANGELWYTNASSVLTQVTGASLNSLDLSSDRMLQAVDRLGYLYIADTGPYRAAGTDGVVSGSATTFDSATYTNWNTVADVGDILWIYEQGTGGAAGDVREYKITEIAVDGSTLTFSPAATNSTAVKFRVLRSVKRFDSSTLQLQSLNALVSDGQAPGGCPLIAVYRDRIVLGGSPIAPHVWYMSRVSDPLDWDYGASDLDPSRAVGGATSDVEKLAEPLTAIIAASTDYLLFGTRNSLWRLQGDPAAGGSIVNLSRMVGVISRGAWCWGPAGEIIFLSRAGLYYLPPGAAATPQPISLDILPDDLIDVDPDTNTISMAYDAFDDGIHLHITGTQTQAWWIDWQTKTFWPTGLSRDHEVHAIATYKEAGGGVSDVLLGGRDGYVRRHLDTADDDDGETLTSTVTYGPILLGGPGFEGLLCAMDAVLSSASDEVTWEVLVGDTHEDAINADVFDSGEWEAGLNATVRPRARGASFCLRITSTNAWEIERVLATIERAGLQKVM